MAKNINRQIYNQQALDRANTKLVRIIQNIIRTKVGGRTKDGKKVSGSPLRSISGNLLKNIKPILRLQGNELVIDMKVMKYYAYLDLGTPTIKTPWFISDTFIESPEFRKVLQDLVHLGVRDTVVSMISDINKELN